MPMKKSDMQDTIIRLYYLTLCEFPVNWLEGTFQVRFPQFLELTCIDNIYEVFFPEFAKRLKEEGKSVYQYIKEKPFSDFPYVENEKMSQIKITNYINKVFKKITEKYEKGDKKAKDLLEHLKILEDGKIPFKEYPQAVVWRAITFKKDPASVNKGSNTLFAFIILYGIEKGDIHGEGTEKLKNAVELYIDVSTKALNIDREKVEKLIKEILK